MRKRSVFDKEPVRNSPERTKTAALVNNTQETTAITLGIVRALAGSEQSAVATGLGLSRAADVPNTRLAVRDME